MSWGNVGRRAVVTGLCAVAAAGCLVAGVRAVGPPAEGVVDTVSGAATAVASAVSPDPSTSPGPSSSSTDVSERLVDDAAWVERDGVRALEVTPADRLRNETDPRVFDEAWRRVVKAVPEADSPGMRDQFVCHATFAADKDSWFLEPERPAVGYWKTVRAGCNPGDVLDVG